jgi:hypothetical protein
MVWTFGPGSKDPWFESPKLSLEFSTITFQFLNFMEKLAAIMKIDRIGADIGFDMSGEALLARATQLMKLETEAVADRSTHIYNLQRKVKAMKQQLESRDLHLDLMRKKVAGLEEKLHGRTDLEREKDTESLRVRKMSKELDKCRENLRLARNEVVDLKAELMECSNLKVRQCGRGLEPLDNMPSCLKVRQCGRGLEPFDNMPSCFCISACRLLETVKKEDQMFHWTAAVVPFCPSL